MGINRTDDDRILKYSLRPDGEFFMVSSTDDETHLLLNKWGDVNDADHTLKSLKIDLKFINSQKMTWCLSQHWET